MLNHFTVCPLCGSELTQHHWRRFCSNHKGCGQSCFDASSNELCSDLNHCGQHYSPYERVRVDEYVIEFYEDGVWIMSQNDKSSFENGFIEGSPLKFGDIDTPEKIEQVIMNYRIIQ